MPILPRLNTRDGDVTPERYEERRRAANRILGTRFRRPPATMPNVGFSSAHLGRDGVHLSRVGEDAILNVIRCLRLGGRGGVYVDGVRVRGDILHQGS